MENVYDGLIAKGRMDAGRKAAILARFTPSSSHDAVRDADLVIEAVFEGIEVKKAAFVQLDKVCKSGAVLATNTSYLDIDAIASVTGRPQDVIGLHFFSPANIMKLLEIVVPSRVSADVVSTAFELAKRMKKVPVRAGVCDGFIGNRILAVYKQAADHLMEDGASPCPMKYADMAGLPNLLADIRRFAQDDPLFWRLCRLLGEQGRRHEHGQGVRIRTRATRYSRQHRDPRRHPHADLDARRARRCDDRRHREGAFAPNRFGPLRRGRRNRAGRGVPRCHAGYHGG